MLIAHNDCLNDCLLLYKCITQFLYPVALELLCPCVKRLLGIVYLTVSQQALCSLTWKIQPFLKRSLNASTVMHTHEPKLEMEMELIYTNWWKHLIDAFSEI